MGYRLNCKQMQDQSAKHAAVQQQKIIACGKIWE
jgi:hypothetical protein